MPKRKLSDAPPPHQSKTWAWTFYYDEPEAQALMARIKEVDLPFQAIKFQREVCPTTGRKHLQGCCAVAKKCVNSTICNLICPGRPQQVRARPCYAEFRSNWDYVSKQETRDVDFPHEVYSHGDPFGHDEPKLDSNGRAAVLLALAEAGDWDTLRTEHPAAWLYQRKALLSARSDALKRLGLVPDQLYGVLDNYWICGAAGKAKDKMAIEMAPGAYIKRGNTKWWDNYDGQKDVILRDVGHSIMAQLDDFKDWTDRYEFPAEIKYGQITIRPTRLIVTSNYQIKDLRGMDPKTLAALERRFQVVFLTTDGRAFDLPRVNIEDVPVPKREPWDGVTELI